MTVEAARQLGRLVKQARRDRGLTLRQLDELTGVSYTWLARLEGGRMLAPAPSKLTKVAEALNLPSERIDLIMRGQIANDLPPIRTYFRAKYRLTSAEIAQIEDLFDQIQRDHRNRDQASR
jgi:transcriptional regulator with XRE-family HTH domain